MHRRTTLALLLVLMSPALLAEDWYEVEIIVFRHDNPSAGNTESWPRDPGRPAVDTALALLAPAPGPLLPFTRLEPDPRRLGGTWDALERSPRYTPLGYWSWIQPGFERGGEPAVRLHLGTAPTAPATLDAQGFPVLGTAVDAPPAVPPLARPLDGVISLGLQRYLYARLDLVYRPEGARPLLVQGPRVIESDRLMPTGDPLVSDPLATGAVPAEVLATDVSGDAPAAPGPDFEGWRLSETRRLRSREVHYFDHPLFGAILLVTPRSMPDIPPPAPTR